MNNFISNISILFLFISAIGVKDRIDLRAYMIVLTLLMCTLIIINTDKNKDK